MTCTLHTEARFSLEELFPGMFGTNDACVLSEEDDTLYIFDLKYGRNHVVEVGTAENPNPQLLYYALGALYKFRDFHPSRVVISIVQPRAPHEDGPVRSLSLDPMDLLDFADKLVAAAQAATTDDAELVVGEHCDDYFCLAKGICPALRKKATEAALVAFSGDPYPDQVPAPAVNPEDLTPEQMAKVMDAAKMIEGWVKAVKARALQLALAGEPPPGWKLVETRATRKWREVEDVIKTLTRDEGEAKEFLTVPELVSPAEAERVLRRLRPKLKAKEAAAIVNQLCDKVSSGATLAPENDSRPAIVKQDFLALISNDTEDC